MDLTEFLLLLFNKDIDQYHEIRKSFMKCWDTKDIVSILARTNYHASSMEFRDMIEHSCFYKGVHIKSLTSPCWYDSSPLIIDETIYNKHSMLEKGKATFEDWLICVLKLNAPVHSVFNVSCNSSEFKFRLTVSVSTRHHGDHIHGSIWISSKIILKEDNTKYIEDMEYAQNLTNWGYPLSNNGLHYISKHVDDFYKALVKPVKEYREEFWKAMYVTNMVF